MTALAIELREVSKRFGAVQSLDRLDLSVQVGSVFGFLGSNGAGKTTTLRVLLGLLRPDGGHLSVLGLDPLLRAAEIRAQVGVLLESDGLYGRLSATANLDFHARIWKLSAAARTARIEELLRSLDLWDRRRDSVVTWSKGMRQKLAIARALLHRPKLVLLDEPFAGLDPVAATDLRNNIIRLAREEGVTVVVTTHDLAHVEKACDQVALIKKGHIIATGAPSEIGVNSDALRVEASGEGLTAEVLSSMQRDGLLVSFTIDERAAVIRCSRENRPRLGAELVRRGVAVEELHTKGNSLEDAFLSLMAAEKTS